jgi:hypothetical protein
MLCQNPRIIACVFLACKGIELATDLFDGFGDLFGVPLGCSLKQEVFDQVGKACILGFFETRTCFHPKTNSN